MALRFAPGQLVASDEALRKASVDFVNDTRQLAAGDDHFACVRRVTCRQFWGCVVKSPPTLPAVWDDSSRSFESPVVDQTRPF